jgi:preprotein translocase subunit SecA
MYNAISQICKKCSEVFISKGNKSLLALENGYRKLSNSELQVKCRDFYLGNYNSEIKNNVSSFLEKLLDLFSFMRSVEEITLEQIALASEIFARVPADLPAGSRLFMEQTSAAVAMTQRCLVQMNTGEGKTYAILPTAFSLVCKYRKVYIVCANPYLASRDATRTKPFWDFIGIKIGLCIEHDEYGLEWECPVIYTTLDALIFTHLGDDTNELMEQRIIQFGAIILDEADHILLDKGQTSYSMIKHIKSDSYDWEFAVRFAKQLKKNEHIVEDYDTQYANLTVEGENYLREALYSEFGTRKGYLIYRSSVEYAYVALFLVKEGVHFIIKKDRVHPVDVLTGEIRYNQEIGWIYPLEYTRGFSPRTSKITLHSLAVGNFFKLFQHLSGTSGSVQEDLAEYFFSYSLLTIIIKPRLPRFNGQKRDSVFLNKKGAMHQLITDAMQEVLRGRPVLIGTQSISDAESVYQLMTSMQHCVDNCRKIEIISGETEEYIAEIFENAGNERMVTIATQLAGRGVDIRLSEQSRKNGGLALFCFEHALTARHDRQFLGRAGRQGDPFSAVFYCSLEDELMLKFDDLASIMKMAGYKEGEIIESSSIDKSILRMQRKIRNNAFMNRRVSVATEIAEKIVYDSFEEWIDNAKQDRGNFSNTADSHFLSWVINKYIRQKIALLKQKKNVTYKDLEPIVNTIATEVGKLIDTRELEGRPLSDIADRMREQLLAALSEKLTNLAAEKKTAIDEFERDVEPVRQVSQCLENVRNFDESMDLPGRAASDDAERYDFAWADSLKQINRDHTLNLSEELECIESLIELGGATEECHAEKLQQSIDQIISSLSILEERLTDSIMPFYAKRELYESRKPASIIYWSIINCRIEYLKEKDRDSLRLFRSLGGGLDYTRQMYDELINDWEKAESQLSVIVLRNLLMADKPGLLSDLFFYADNAVYIEQEANNSNRKEMLAWLDQKKNEKQENYINTPDKSNGLIQRFVEAQGQRLCSGKYSTIDITNTLTRFLRGNPFPDLNSSANILKALMSWTKEEIDLSIVKNRRTANKQWVVHFLYFLSKQGVIAKPPSFRIKISSYFSQILSNLSDIKTVLSLVQPVLFLVIFTLLSLFGKWMQPHHLDGLFLLIDYSLFAGMLSTGAITACCFMVASFWKFNKNYINLILISMTFLIVMSLQTNWHHISIVVVLTNTLKILAAAFITYHTIHITEITQANTGIMLKPGWFCFCILFVLFPHIYGWQSVEMLFLLAGCFIYGFWRNRVMSEELTLLSSFSSSSSSSQSEDIRSGFKIEGTVGYMPHVYAAFAAMCSMYILSRNGEISLLGKHFADKGPLLAIYLVVAGLMIYTSLKSKLLPESWNSLFNKKHVLLIDGDEQANVVELNTSEKLQAIFNKFFLLEIAFHGIVVVFCYCMFRSFFPETHIPVFMIMPAMFFFVAEQLYRINQRLIKLIITRAPTSYEAIEAVDFKTNEERLSWFEKMKSLQYVKKFIFFVFTLLAGLKFLFELIENSKEVMKYISSFFK